MPEVGAAAARLRARNLRTLALLAGLFLLPLVLAFCTYYGSSWRPPGSVNHGVLVSPPRAMPAASLAPLAGPEAPGALLRGRWSLVYLGGGECGPECARALAVMRDARLALNQDVHRVAPVYLARSPCCSAEFLAAYPALEVRDARSADAAALLAAFPEPDADTLYVVDPLGNLMMRYDARANSRGLLEDLQKLLRLSHIG